MPNLPAFSTISPWPHLSQALAGRLPFLEVGHLLGGALQVLLEALVEGLERFLVVGLALLDFVELVFHPRRVLDVEDVVEDRMQQLVDQPAAENRRPEPALDLVHVVARLEHGNDRRVGARPADAVLFERLDQRPFVESRGRLRELLLGRDLAELQRLPFASAPAARRPARPRLTRRRPARRLAGLLGALALLGFGRCPGRRPPASRRTSAPSPWRGRGSRARPSDVDGRVVEQRGHHLRGDETIPDQAIEVVLVRRQVRAHRLRVVRHRRRPDRFVRVLRRGLHLVAIRLLRHVRVAVLRRGCASRTSSSAWSATRTESVRM